jgi:hypothetical protein
MVIKDTNGSQCPPAALRFAAWLLARRREGGES